MQARPGGGLGFGLNTTTLLRTAAVVWDRCHISNGSDADTQSPQGTNRRFATWSGTLDLDVEVLDALFLSSTACNFGSDLSCKRCRFTRTLEALSTGRCPRQSIALAIRDGDDGVVERSVNVCNAVSNVLADFFADSLRCAVGLCFCHVGLSVLLISSEPQHPCGGLCECAHWYEYADHAWAGHDGDGNRGSNRCPSNA
jgi:hypothetical protein